MTKNARKSISWILLAVFLVMFLFNLLTPVISDDYAFSFDGNGNRVSSISQIFPLLKDLRQNTNGRVFSHFFVYLFQMLPRIIFQILNAGNTVAIVLLLFSFVKSENTKKNIIILLSLIAMLWLFTPEYGSVYLGLTGACNYSWGLTLFLVILLPLSRCWLNQPCFITDSSGVLRKILFLILAFVTGAYSENGATSVIFIAFFLIFIPMVEKKKFSWYPAVVFVMLCAGFLFMMSSPSELHGRAGDFSLSAIFDSAKSCLMSTYEYCKYLYAIYAVLLAFAFFFKRDVQKIWLSIFLVLGGMISIAVFAFAAYLPSRSFYVMVTYTVLAIGLLMGELWQTDGKKELLALFAVLVMSFSFQFIFGAGDIFSVYLQSSERQQTILNAKANNELDVTLSPLISSTKYPAVIHEMLYGSDWWYNDCIATYYGLNSVTASDYEDAEDAG